MGGFGSSSGLRSLAVAGLALGLIAMAGVEIGRAGDRSVTIIEGVDEPGPAAPSAPVPPGPLPSLTADNSAGITLAIAPGPTLALGTRISFTVTTRRPGYLVLVDINADGRMAQIYPNMTSLSQTSGKVASINMIAPGTAVTVPNPKNALARFVFTADPPLGRGAVVAIVSDRPVQIIDLPETAGGPQDLQALVDLLSKRVLDLKIASADETGKFAQGGWSFAAVAYAIQ